jgi:hypothetical protein
MSSNLLSVPCSFLIALLVAKMGLVALNLPLNIGWLSGAVAAAMLLLYKRNLLELGLITVLAVLAEMHSHTGVDPQVSPDVLLSVLITIIILPLSLDIMGIAQPEIGSPFKSH